MSISSKTATVLGQTTTSGLEFSTRADGPKGRIPFTPEMLATEPSGYLFGMSQSAGMGWAPDKLLQKHFLIISTAGGIRKPDGTPTALGLHTGHWELSTLVSIAADTLRDHKAMPFAVFCSDPCDGRTQGTPGMMDSLAYRNDASIVMRRLARSLPTSKGVLGVASCDKGLPATMMALAGLDLPCVVVPGGSTLAPRRGEDAGKIQSIGARFAQGEVTLEYAQEMGCKACASPGGGCQFMGTAGTSQVISEALGIAVPHSACAPSGSQVWRDIAVRASLALLIMEAANTNIRDILTTSAFENAMIVHAAVGGSTNLLLHLPAIAHSAGQKRMIADDWIRVNKETPRITDVLPNGPVGYPTPVFYAAGGVPEVMLQLRREGLLNGSTLTVSGVTLDEVIDWWEDSERRHKTHVRLQELEGISSDEVIMSKKKARAKGMNSTVLFPKGNIAPEGSVIKSAAIHPSVIEPDGVYRKVGKARVFHSEPLAIKAVKSKGKDKILPGEIMVLACAGPMGSGMEETYQITAALAHLSYGKEVALITDARFSGVSTGACIGHVGPEALAGGPIGKIREGDIVRIEIDPEALVGMVDLVGTDGEVHGAEWGRHELAMRKPHQDLKRKENMPWDTIMWSVLQSASGGTWGGCVYDPKSIVGAVKQGMQE